MSQYNNSNGTGNIELIMPFEKCEDCYIEPLENVKTGWFYSFFKRLFDILFSFFALLFLAIPMLIIAAIIILSYGSKAIYHQERLGLNGIPFDLIKFRTMYDDAEDEAIQWSSGDDDPRITPFGRILRKTRLDELPQFWCILKGDMSLVGPRPERPMYYVEFEKYIHGFSERLKVKPGLTGLAQVRGGYYLKPEEKIVFDVEYIKKRSVWLDIKIVFNTVKVVFTSDGAK